MNYPLPAHIQFLRLLLLSVLLAGNSKLSTAIPQMKSEPKEIWLGDVLNDQHAIKYRDYVIQERQRKVYNPQEARIPIDVSYAVLKRSGRTILRFDDNIYFGLGNDTRFGLASLLGGQAKQALISQDAPRTGTQWVVMLSQRPRIIFNGPQWSVGREGDDMSVVDLDGDGVYEIMAPITDFYGLQDKMSMSQIPLPLIIFKYSSYKRRYLPANSRFKEYALEGMTTLPNIGTEDQLQHRSLVLRRTLALIYVGKRKDGWRNFNQSYKLNDKVEIIGRVRAILVRQPVYRFIYNRSEHK